MEHILYWLWLTTKSGISSSKIVRLLEHYKSVEEIYYTKNFNIDGFSEKHINLLRDKNLSKAKYVLDRTVRIGSYIIVYDDERYPEILRNTPCPPHVLYVLGDFPDINNLLTIGIVGTRHSSDYGRVVTERISTDLASKGVITVSGLAAGIDAVAAWATVDVGGCHVGVVGNGLDIVYPGENAELAKQVIQNGCIISEFYPGIKPFPSNFPMRNRIIAGLSRGVLVTEAPEKSGALITAKYALDYNRDVFAVPRDITAVKYQGTNSLIRSGAKLTQCADDIISEYPYASLVPKNLSPRDSGEHKTINKNNTKHDSKLDSLTGIEKDIADLLKKSDMQIDEITRFLEKPVGEINTKLIMLEMKGIIKKLPGSKYQLNI